MVGGYVGDLGNVVLFEVGDKGAERVRVVLKRLCRTADGLTVQKKSPIGRIQRGD